MGSVCSLIKLADKNFIEVFQRIHCRDNHFKHYGCLEIIYVGQKISLIKTGLKLERWICNELGLCGSVFSFASLMVIRSKMGVFEALSIFNYCQPYFSLFFIYLL